MLYLLCNIIFSWSLDHISLQFYVEKSRAHPIQLNSAISTKINLKFTSFSLKSQLMAKTVIHRFQVSRKWWNMNSRSRSIHSDNTSLKWSSLSLECSKTECMQHYLSFMASHTKGNSFCNSLFCDVGYFELLLCAKGSLLIRCLCPNRCHSLQKF